MQGENERIRNLTEQDVGLTEENVKQKIVVPVLEWLGHKRENMEFEYKTQGGGRIDILLGKNLPRDCKVLIDTKKYNEELDEHIDQIKKYTFDEAALLAVLANGTEFKIYALLGGVAFERSLLYVIRRSDLGNESILETLIAYLGFDNLKNRNVHKRIAERERQIQNAMAEEDTLKQDFEDKSKKLDLEIDEKDDELAQLKLKKAGHAKELDAKIAEIWKNLNLPPQVADSASTRLFLSAESGEDRTEISGRARKVTFQELIEKGALKDGESLYLCYRTKEFKDCKAQVVANSNQLRYRDELYSKSKLASKLLQKLGVIKHSEVQGPQCWKTLDGNLLLDLEQKVRRGDSVENT